VDYLIRDFSYEEVSRFFGEITEIENKCFEKQWTSNNFLLKVPDKEKLSILAFKDGKLIGYVIASSYFNIAHLNRIAIHPDFQGHGIGRLLMTRLEKKAKENHLGSITLELDSKKKALTKFYLPMGFSAMTESEISEYKNRKGKHLLEGQNVYLKRIPIICTIHQPNFLPWVGYFKKILDSDIFVILDDVQFSKQSYTQRTKIKTNNGFTQWLSVPIIKQDYFKLIKEVRINNALKWKDQHLETLRNNYSKTKFFSVIFPSLEFIYRQEWSMLLDFNIAFLKFCLNYMGNPFDFVFSSTLNIESNSNNRILDICKRLNAGTYITGQGSKDYLIPNDFENIGINIKYLEIKNIEYPQIGKKFISGLSILDLLFNESRENSLRYLQEI
jgi:ribosomal protein S18 acetylase RimI-like enzyme